MNAVQLRRSTEINYLHAELGGYFRVGLQKAIRIGQLLTEQKTELPHGDWTPWIEQKLDFNERTVRRYMRVYERRADLKTDTVSVLTLSQAYKLLEEPRAEEPAPAPEPEAVEYVSDGEGEIPAEAADRIRSENDEEVQELESRIRDLERTNTSQAGNIRELQREIEENKAKLKDLGELENARAEIKRVQDRIHQLQMKQTKAFEDAAGVDAITNALVHGRQFFTQQCMEIPALKVTRESRRVMRGDVEALVDLVENWIAAIRQRFLEE